MVRRTRRVALITLTLLDVFTLAAGVAVVKLLPARLAMLKVAEVAPGLTIHASQVLDNAGTSATSLPTNAGLRAALGGALRQAALGSHVGAVIADASTGRVLAESDGTALFTPASTAKLVTATVALAVLGPDKRFTTRVVSDNGGIVLVGGGDPTLAADPPPKSNYPQPATLAELAAETAQQLKQEHRTSVTLRYDTSMYTGPAMASGWLDNYITNGDVTPITSLEVDQGRLTTSGQPEDADDPDNFAARTTNPVGMAVQAFTQLLKRDDITVTGTPASTTATASAQELASVSSPPLSEIVEWMLLESNNVIAENLARQVAIAEGEPASFLGAAAAEETELKRLGIDSGIHLVDGSGLSPDDGITPITLVNVLKLATATTGHGRLRAVITGLPVAGFAGTLSQGQSVFGGINGNALGVVRAKTGNLDTVASLAGLADAKDGHLLIFAFMADKVPAAGMLQAAANAIDTAAAALAACGCRLVPAVSTVEG
jgi:D-alanyl-D-alanine carboxypeptidase/D-alanyl-D-alanine-endopeptidase (penicillin-binding protein 4)